MRIMVLSTFVAHSMWSMFFLTAVLGWSTVLRYRAIAI